MVDSSSSVTSAWNAPAILGVIFGAILLVIEFAHLIVAIIAHRVSLSSIAIYSTLLIIRISIRTTLSLVFHITRLDVPRFLMGYGVVFGCFQGWNGFYRPDGVYAGWLAAQICRSVGDL